MGGNKKQAQRTKNNARPSNSGRSAELLSNTVTHFSNFSGMKETGFNIPTLSLSTIEDFELDIDINFQLVFKKMNKKDSTTKLKALQEFADLIQKSDAEAVKAVLPFWPRLYNILVIDYEPKVREATHVAHNEVVKKVKRNLAPYLKQLIASWFTSQYDTYAPAATAATSSFNSAFPENKIEGVIVFCEQEILTYIHDNLLVQTPQTVCDQKHNLPEVSQAKYERVLISSLHGYSLYLNKMKKDKIEASIELNKKIISSNKFWKYAKHNLSLVRAAWFEVLTALFQKAPFLLENEESHITLATLSSIDESDPIVLPLVWQNVLLTITLIKEWWTKVNVDKLLLPKLWKVLREGGQGNASVIYPNLLPMLPSLTPVLDVSTFYNNFFQNLCLGQKQKSVISSKSECTAVSTSLIECLRYVIMKNESDVSLCEQLIKTHLMPTLEWCLLETQSCYKTIFNQTASLAQYWSRNDTSEFPNYCRYLNYFWNIVDQMFQDVLMNLNFDESEKIFNVSSRQIEFLQSMKHVAKVKKSLKVKFDSDNTLANSGDIEVTSSGLGEFYINSLTDLVFKLCQAYVKIIDNKKSKELLDHLVVLIQEFDSKNLFLHISSQVGSEEQNGVIDIFQNLLTKWLQREELWCRSLIDLIFMAFKYLVDEEKQIVLDTVEKISNEDCLAWCLEDALSHQHNKDCVIRNWLTSDKVTNFIVSIVEKEIADQCAPNLKSLLRIAVTEDENEELYVSQQAIFKMVNKLKEPLMQPNDYLLTIDASASFASYLSAIVYTEKLLLTYTDELLIAMISMSLESGVATECLTDDTIWEVQTAWQDAISTLASGLSQAELETVLEKVASMTMECFEDEDFDDKKFKKLVDLLIGLCRSIHKGIPLNMDPVLDKLFKRTSTIEWRKTLTDLCKAGEYLNGKLASCYDEFRTEVEADDRELLKFFAWVCLKIKVLSAHLEDCADYDDEEDEGGIEKVTICSVLDARIDWICEMLYDSELGICFLENYCNVRFSTEIQGYISSGSSKLLELLGSLQFEEKSCLKDMLRTNAYKYSWIWCRTLYNYNVNYSSDVPVNAYDDLVKDATSSDKLLVIQATQVFAKHLNFDCVSYTSDDISRVIVLRHLSFCQEIDVQIAEVMLKVESFRTEDIARFNWESFKMKWNSYQMILETARLFNAFIKFQFDTLSQRYIDLIVICLAEWLPRLNQYHKLQKVHPMIIAVIDLLQNITTKIDILKESGTKKAFTKEWDDLFAEDIQNELIKLWLNLAGEFKNDQKSPLTSIPLMHSVLSITACFNHKILFKNATDKADKKIDKLMKESCLLLTSPMATLQLAAYKSLITLIPSLVEIDSVAVNTNRPNQNGLIFEQFKEVCSSMQEIVSTMLMGYKLGEDSCRVEPFTESYSYTFAYLLMWDVLLTLCEKASTELKYQYADWLRKENILKDLFNNLFRLMPLEILHCLETKSPMHSEWFSCRPALNPKDIYSSENLEHMVCWIYSLTLSQLPVLVRQWWSVTDSKTAQLVERITSTYVAPLLCAQELSDIRKYERSFKNMTIKVMPTVKEVIAIYSVDEAQMELLIRLPPNYPLAGPEVHCNRQIGGTSHKQWLMQFKKCVLHQNGRIWDGLSLWNNNLDKKFDGVEECYICFSVLHPGTYQLPKLSCQTCRKKFHSACLYKWFSTSNKSSCPVCRNLF
ncbi:hypothetical protein WA026_004187 [Henosepilachna vigintioctopunctata]|uniref:E3 ubiquitin-protein ligase listerin n=1 Tax=Henosepilachna vigintioctopunctata TaxID=420089 RepID=A0AAW1UEY1_9CUCU